MFQNPHLALRLITSTASPISKRRFGVGNKRAPGRKTRLWGQPYGGRDVGCQVIPYLDYSGRYGEKDEDQKNTEDFAMAFDPASLLLYLYTLEVYRFASASKTRAYST